MKHKVLIYMILVSAVLAPAMAQNAGTSAGKYLRPSVTYIYINRGEPLSTALIEQMEANGVSAKFNNNHVSRNVVSIRRGEPVSTTKLGNLLQTQITKEIAKLWFPFDASEGEYSRKVMYQRGMDAATYQDTRTAGATFLKDAWLKDAGKLLIDRSYIVVYDVFNIRTTNARAAKGYIADCDVYLYKLNWNTSLYAVLFDDANVKNPDYINTLTFPVQHVASLTGKSNLRNAEVSEPESWSDAQVLNHFAAEIVSKADNYLADVNPDFQVQTPIYALSPIRARVGTKEGLSVDQRYFVYEQVQDARGVVTSKRRGVIRAKKVAYNAGNNALTSSFYQTSGGKLDAGMNLKQAPDAGMALAVYGGPNDVSALLELNIGMWASKHGMGETNFPYGTKVYIKYTHPLNEMTTFIENLDGTTDKVKSLGILGGGVSKDICFARLLALTPYAGFTGLLAFDKLQPELQQVKTLRIGAEVGLNLTVAFSPAVALIGNINYNTVRKAWYSEDYSFGGGLRVSF